MSCISFTWPLVCHQLKSFSLTAQQQNIDVLSGDLNLDRSYVSSPQSADLTMTYPMVHVHMGEICNFRTM